ncbi:MULTISPECIES: hypothetical protein [unclassified Bradyrhizobium]|uniref:hypothetical protein n=1 Tax=unclassified Bradyrhizobium TaxID=2631580 RepID=UPI00289A366D|nr:MULTISPECIES: hypothetical protein [unclassified Bradyrhizobium]
MSLQADFTSQEFFRDPATAIEKLRTIGPVVEVRFPIIGKVWATTTQALADQVLKDTKTFTIRRDDGNVAGLQWWMPGIVRTLANSMLSMDEPNHKRCATSSTKRSAAVPCSTWSRISRRSATSLPMNCSPMAVPPISSSALRAGCRCR